MRKLILMLIISLSFITFSCKEITTQDTSIITNYVTFEFPDAIGTDQLGNEMVIIEKGSDYDINLNYVAMEGTEEVQDVQIDGTLDTSTPGYYPISYSAVNQDGYAAGKTKGIFVSNPDVTTDISGSYTATVYRTPTGETFTAGYPVTVTKITDGIFYFDRLLGSYYYDGYGYSAYGSYFVHGFLALNEDNSFSLTSPNASYSPAWHDRLGGLDSGSYDPETNTITINTIYAGGRVFHVTMTLN
jgi:hypothetical protein